MPTLPQTGAPHKLAEGDWAAALEADMQFVVRRAHWHIVDAELTALLGPRYAWDAARVGYRHGTKVRTVTSPVGAVTVTVPRARLQTPITGRAEWESQVLPAYARRMRQVNAALLQVYLCGGNSRRIRGALGRCFGGVEEHAHRSPGYASRDCCGDAPRRVATR